MKRIPNAWHETTMYDTITSYTTHPDTDLTSSSFLWGWYDDGCRGRPLLPRGARTTLILSPRFSLISWMNLKFRIRSGSIRCKLDQSFHWAETGPQSLVHASPTSCYLPGVRTRMHTCPSMRCGFQSALHASNSSFLTEIYQHRLRPPRIEPRAYQQ